MCTVTIVPYNDGFRLVCNRDERRDRPAAAPPTVHRLEYSAAIYPVDPSGGGTWVGVNDAGLAAALLNRTIDAAESPRRSRRTPQRSRGLIIPKLLGCRSLTDALDMAAGLDPARFDLFRLALVQRMAAVVVTSDGLALSAETMSLSQPLADILVARRQGRRGAATALVRAARLAKRGSVAGRPNSFPCPPVAVAREHQRQDGTRGRTDGQSHIHHRHVARERAALRRARLRQTARRHGSVIQDLE